MDHYLDLHLLPDPEFPTTQLMNALLAKLHRGLHDLRRDDIGISFPAIDSKSTRLGSHLRLHGTAQALDTLLALNWLTGMRDHVRLGDLSSVPPDTRHRVVSRVQTDSSPERTRRRLIKRHGITEEQARERIPDHAAKRCNLPFAQLRSQTTGQHFRLFIRHGPLLDKPEHGAFNGFGLSSRATVPWF
ncbi:type I-F CRISPR-associated endoribonuclease Cas6/Csy4 [Pseudomonas syringae]|nr:type I-F CRISPR-associated endoribonuclease Cas6/Csy4 [Pseudomonas syringae]